MKRYKNILTFIGSIDELPDPSQNWIPDGSIFIEEKFDETSDAISYRKFCKLNEKWEIIESNSGSGLPTEDHIHRMSDILNLEATITQLNSTIQNKLDIPTQPDWDNFVLTLSF